MIEWKIIVWFILTVLLMGFFAGIEMAFFSANRLNIELKRKQGSATGHLLGKFVDSPATFLGTTLIGFIIFLVFFGLQISTVLQPMWKYFNVGSDLVHILVEIVIATFLVLILAEFIPRAIFRARSNTLLSKLSIVTNFFYQMFQPLATGLISLAEWMLKYVFNVKLDKTKEAFNRSDLRNLFQQNHGDDDRQERNTQLLENAQELPRVKIRQCLVPRKEIIGVDITISIEDLILRFSETKLSKMVVYDSNIDHIVGYVHELDLFKRPSTIQEVLLAIPAVPESMSAADLINKLSRERKSIAWVVDEFGGTAGIITMEDVLEELFGEIFDEYDTEQFVEKRISETEYIFSGRLELDYLEEKYSFVFPENDAETLSGYIIGYHETIPRQKERIIIDDYEFDVLNVSDTRIEMVKMKKLK
ncbi:hemolysin family protein [Terrimonas ferruginea]|uniref:hemolysin family protein n=1 Tax=Terrimonas ferruginea TaxID=249 RepID=UPI0004078149|nr:hemolysin family protein [Terrimonas ferruginea]